MSVIEPFMQIVPLVFAAELLKSAKLAIAALLIKAERLKTERIEKGVLAAALSGFALCGIQ
ncbi:hypothetical protein P3T20_002286 [Paraburkholderia sp. GAS206C]